MSDEPPRVLPLLMICAPSLKTVPGARALLAPDARMVDDPAMAAAVLSDWPEARLVVFCPRPEVWLALALGLAAGEGPSQALQNWRAQVQPLIALLRARRRQAVLLFEGIFVAAPALCAAALGLPAPEAAIVAREDDDPVLILLARKP